MYLNILKEKTHKMHKNAHNNSVKRELKGTRSIIEEMRLKISWKLFISIYEKLI